MEAEAAWLGRASFDCERRFGFAKEPRTETILREVIADAEDRLGALEQPEEPR
jgi:hypothetical protein